jgi:hypothetical protein
MTNGIVSHIKPFLIIPVTAADLAIPKASLPDRLLFRTRPTQRDKMISKQQPSWPTVSSSSCSRRRMHEYGPALSHIGQQESHRIGSKTDESIGGPIHGPRFFFDSACRRSIAGLRHDDPMVLSGVGAGGLEISQHYNIEFLYSVKQTK